MSNIWIIITGILVAICSGSLGCYLVLQKRAMLADAISHAVLPGIVIAYLLSGDRSPYLMLIAASISGLVATFLVDWLEKKVGLQADSSIGVTYTWMFAVGIILLAYFAGQTDLDQECVLFGELIYVPLHKTEIFGFKIPIATTRLSILMLVIIGFLIACGRSLQLYSFDSAFAAFKGLSTTLLHYTFLGLISTTTVFSFESVGVILVIALLVIPPISAKLWASSVNKMILISVIYSIASVLIGFALAYYLDNTLSATITLSSAALFILSFIVKQILVRKKIEQNFSTASISHEGRV